MDVSGDSVSYCSLNVLICLTELGAMGFNVCLFYHR